MKIRLLAVLSLALASLSAADAPRVPLTATTITKSAVKIGGGSFALTKGTKLEVLGREGDFLVVKFRSTQGKIPLAETDFDPETVLPEPAPAPLPASAKHLPDGGQDKSRAGSNQQRETAGQTPGGQQPTTVQPAPVTPAVAPATKPAAPPALSVDGKPASTYGKAVQKAKQVTETRKGTHVEPTDEILDEKPKK